MRDNNYEPRLLPPVWRRIIILLAVIAAVPVVLWSITAFVRAYVAPPKVPSFRPIGAMTSAAPPETSPVTAGAAAQRTAAIEDNKPAAVSPAATPAVTTAPKPTGMAPIVEARRTATDARVALVDVNSRPSDAPPAPGPAVMPDSPSATASPDPAPAETTATVAQQAPAPPKVEEEMPAGEPIAGPIPLPPHRPRVFAMAPGAIPVPRPRPDLGEQPANPAGDLSRRDYMN